MEVIFPTNPAPFILQPFRDICPLERYNNILCSSAQAIHQKVFGKVIFPLFHFSLHSQVYYQVHHQVAQARITACILVDFSDDRVRYVIWVGGDPHEKCFEDCIPETGCLEVVGERKEIYEIIEREVWIFRALRFVWMEQLIVAKEVNEDPIRVGVVFRKGKDLLSRQPSVR